MNKELIKIDFGGKLRTIVINLNTMAEYDSMVGGNSLTENIFAQMDANKLRALLFTSLKVDDPEITIEEVGGWAALAHYGELIETMTKAFGLYQPEVKEGSKKKVKEGSP